MNLVESMCESWVILVEYDKDNVEHCIGLLVSSLETICTVEEKSIQHIQNHFLGSGTLIESLVEIKDIDDNKESKVAMLLNIKILFVYNFLQMTKEYDFL